MADEACTKCRGSGKSSPWSHGGDQFHPFFGVCTRCNGSGKELDPMVEHRRHMQSTSERQAEDAHERATRFGRS